MMHFDHEKQIGDKWKERDGLRLQEKGRKSEAKIDWLRKEKKKKKEKRIRQRKQVGVACYCLMFVSVQGLIEDMLW